MDDLPARVAVLEAQMSALAPRVDKNERDVRRLEDAAVRERAISDDAIERGSHVARRLELRLLVIGCAIAVVNTAGTLAAIYLSRPH